MAVSKRLRFEILKRDNHTCQYCGCSAPDVVLQVDHIIPATLGGDDSPKNLTTACRDCNSGKASSSPGASKVEAPSVDAHRYRKAIEEAAADHRRHREREREVCDLFAAAWPWSSPPDDWERDVSKFIRMGLAPEDVLHILERAKDRCNGYQHTWLYFCKVCWAEVKLIRGRAEAALAETHHAPTPEPAESDPAEVIIYEEFRPEPPPFFAPLPEPVWLCLECDDRPAGDDGWCDTCRHNHYEGLA